MDTVLVIEDSRAMQRTLQRLFEADSLAVEIASDGVEGLEIFKKQTPRVVVLDLKLPRLSGKELCRAFKAHMPSVPIVVLSANAEIEDKVLLLELGADDYVTKPFSAPELLARVRAALRRNVRGAEQSSVLQLNDIQVDLARRETHGPHGEIHLTPLEYRVLECLARHLGSIVIQNQLVREVWGPERLGDTRSLRVCVKNLRNKLEPDPRKPRYLVTEAGLGYRLRADDIVDDAQDRTD